MVALRFNGKAPFVLQMVNLTAEGNSSAGQVTLTADDLEMAPVEVSGAPSAAGLYQVPVTLALRHALPREFLRGGFFTGKVTLAVVGLPNKTQTLTFSFRNPSLLQRYLSPYITPVYARLPWALCAWPLTLFLLLVAVARIRGRGVNDVEIDEAAVATAMPMPSLTPTEIGSTAGATTFANPPSLDAVWGNAEWGTAWGSEAGERPAGGVPATNGAGGGDPWRSSW
jgi:hypothetical protein